jgi:hypothetical protein
MLEIIEYCMFCSTRFASLSVGSGNEAANCSPHVPHPVYGSGLASAMSHTYINQYTGSEYNLDKVQVRNLQLMAVRIFRNRSRNCIYINPDSVFLHLLKSDI